MCTEIDMRSLYLIALLLFAFYNSAAWAQDCSNPNGVIGEVIYNGDSDVVQGCTASAGWIAFHGDTGYSPGPTGCPSIGDTCDDGSYFIGDIGAGSVYATNEGFESLQYWNDGNTNWSLTNVTNPTDGAANTATLVTADSDQVTGGTQPHDAAIYCDGLSAHGHSDWYLPARDELNLFWNSGAPVANVDESGSFPDGWYWSSTEVETFENRAYDQNFNDGSTPFNGKSNAQAVRCVRKE